MKTIEELQELSQQYNYWSIVDDDGILIAASIKKIRKNGEDEEVPTNKDFIEELEKATYLYKFVTVNFGANSWGTKKRFKFSTKKEEIRKINSEEKEPPQTAKKETRYLNQEDLRSSLEMKFEAQADKLHATLEGIKVKNELELERMKLINDFENKTTLLQNQFDNLTNQLKQEYKNKEYELINKVDKERQLLQFLKRELNQEREAFEQEKEDFYDKLENEQQVGSQLGKIVLGTLKEYIMPSTPLKGFDNQNEDKERKSKIFFTKEN